MLAKFADVKLGDMLIPDHGFDCLEAGKPVEVMQDDKGRLYVPCRDHRHYLDGQENTHGDLVGLSVPNTEKGS